MRVTSAGFVVMAALSACNDAVDPDPSDGIPRYQATDLDALVALETPVASGPFVWRAGVAKLLAQKVETPGWTITSALALTSEGRIFARAEFAGLTKYVVLVPIP